MHFDEMEDELEFAAVPVSEDMQSGLIQAFRDAENRQGESDHCPICAYLASMGQDVSHEQVEHGGAPVLSWVDPNALERMRAKPGARSATSEAKLSKAQHRRFRKRRR